MKMFNLHLKVSFCTVNMQYFAVQNQLTVSLADGGVHLVQVSRLSQV